MTAFKPLLACDADLEKLRFPLLASPKLDGIRCLIHPELGPVTRNLKPIANIALRERLAGLPPWLDGELVCGEPTAKNCMQRTSSAVMSSSNDSSDVIFYAFDYVDESKREYRKRLAGISYSEPLYKILDHAMLYTIEQLMHYETWAVTAGYEGIMLRDPEGVYKFGRSTVKEGILLKVKRFSDMEGVVIGFVERQHNGNEATKDNLGRTKRSTAKAGKTGAGTLGAITLRTIWNDEEISLDVGTGFIDAERLYIWHHQNEYSGKTATFKYQYSGSKDAPRFPVFKCWRGDA